MSFPLPPEFERAVLDRVASGQYASTDDVLATALRALEHAEAEFATLRREVQVGIDQIERGQVVDGEEAFAWLRERVGSDRHASSRDMLHALVSALEEREQEELEALRREVRIGLDELDRGERYSREEVLARLREARPGARI